MKRFICLATTLTLISVPLRSTANPSVPSSEEYAKATILVQQLGDPKFRIRDTASKELLAMGVAAKQALKEGLKSNDPEIWNRCSQLLPRILELDLQIQVEAFLADHEGKKKYDLPLWNEYQKLIGADAASRKLFGEILKDNAWFLYSIANDPDNAAEKYASRAVELQQKSNSSPFGTIQGRPGAPINAPDIAALLLVGLNEAVIKKAGGVGPVDPSVYLLYQNPFRAALQSGETTSAYRKLFFTWAGRREDINATAYCLNTIQNMRLNCKESIEFLLKTANSKDLQGFYRAQAISILGQLSTKDSFKEHLPTIEKMFKDDAVFANNVAVQVPGKGQVLVKVQIRDVALATAAYLTGQAVKEYGYDALQNQIYHPSQYYNLGFSTEEKRTAAFKKWDDWSAAQKKDDGKKKEPGKADPKATDPKEKKEKE